MALTPAETIASQKHGLPIYKMKMNGSTVYVINSPNLIRSVQKQPKTLSFPPIAADFSKTACGSSKEADDIMQRNINGDEGDWGFSVAFYKILHPSLAPGPALDPMNRVMIEEVANSMDKLLDPHQGVRRLKLKEWIRHVVTIASTNSIYGPMNPFKDKKVEYAFW